MSKRPATDIQAAHAPNVTCRATKRKAEADQLLAASHPDAPDSEVYAALKIVATGWDVPKVPFSQSVFEQHVSIDHARSILQSLTQGKA